MVCVCILCVVCYVSMGYGVYVWCCMSVRMGVWCICTMLYGGGYSVYGVRCVSVVWYVCQGWYVVHVLCLVYV